MHIVPVPCLYDNYAYLIIDDDRRCTIVDPSEIVPIQREMERQKVKPFAVLCTHHHGDHVGGLSDLLDEHPKLPVYGHKSDGKRIAGLTHGVTHEEVIEVGASQVVALHVPGHTSGAVTWVVQGAAFTGDTLFVAGCGRLFEGDAATMYRSLNDVLGTLEPSTRVYCGHEYTESNLRFARHVEPKNGAVTKKIEEVKAQRGRREPTVPSTLAEELEFNPFLRCSEPGVIEFARREGAPKLDPVSVFSVVRSRKNQF